jgi:hypothetical protein
MQRSGSIAKLLGLPFLPARASAPLGQAREQAVHSTLSVLMMQHSRSTVARPICVTLFSAALIGRRAPVGQTTEQATQLTRQNPRSKESAVCSIPDP